MADFHFLRTHFFLVHPVDIYCIYVGIYCVLHYLCYLDIYCIYVGIYCLLHYLDIY